MRPLAFSGEAVYAVVFWVTYTIWVASEWTFIIARRSKDRTKEQDRGSLNLLMAAIWLGLGLDFTLAFLVPQAAIGWERQGVFFLGIGLMLAGMAFRWYSIAVLGKYFTVDVAVHAGQTVVEAGPYRYIRHPSYTGVLVTFVGVRGSGPGAGELGGTGGASDLRGHGVWLPNAHRRGCAGRGAG